MMTTKQAAAPVRFKSIGTNDTEGTFEAVVSVFGNIDSVGDVVMPGAFAEDLEFWKSSGNPIPVIWSHQWSDPDYHIGHVVEASETVEGLFVKGIIDLESPKGAQVHRLLKGGRVTQFSFAYDVLDAGPGLHEGIEVLELRKLHVHEVGPTLLGANRATRLVDAKAGRMLSTKNLGALSEARELIAGIIDAAQSDDDAESVDVSSPPAASEEPVTHPTPEVHPVNPCLRDADSFILISI